MIGTNDIDLGYELGTTQVQTRADRLHPNQAGGNLMAPVWFQGIRAVPEPSSAALATAAASALLALGCRRRGLLPALRKAS